MTLVPHPAVALLGIWGARKPTRASCVPSIAECFLFLRPHSRAVGLFLTQHSGITPADSGDHRGGRGLNLGQLNARPALYLLLSLSSPARSYLNAVHCYGRTRRASPWARTNDTEPYNVTMKHAYNGTALEYAMRSHHSPLSNGLFGPCLNLSVTRSVGWFRSVWPAQVPPVAAALKQDTTARYSRGRRTQGLLLLPRSW